ncbi:glucosaminidase domain-containing protein [Staphylococcus coagulans]|uniref:glucosaminidase domain-containing protein n=1 Tax=Staphylococcus coagulans TaxID=74706 RepID=UPI001F4C3FC5|nr:glucosaminidase domain-containing protein [Staphylococcus coagulans]UNB45550.1 glucosaminidase domain-containing protein [Staphylococcus coagulans]
MALPKNGKPTASQVVEWAKDLAKRHGGVDVDGYYGYQCWDLPNYILKKYWGFTTWGNANAMAQKSNYRGYNFKILRNTPSFVPKPGDWAVWAGSNPGHVNIVVGPSTKKYFYAVNQNWRNNNSYVGSKATLEKHDYNGVTHFVRPPYKKETIKDDHNPSPAPQPQKDPKPDQKPEEPRWKNIKKVEYTLFSSVLDQKLQYIDHNVALGNLQKESKGIYLKESSHLRSVKELYIQRNKYIEEDEYPHAYVDREHVWITRPINFEVPLHPGWLVIEVCGGLTENKRQFMLNQIRALIYGVWLLGSADLKLSKSSLKVDDNIWRTMKDLIDYDLIKNGIPDNSKYEDVEKKLIEMYGKRDKLLRETIYTNTTNTKINIKPSTSVDNTTSGHTTIKGHSVKHTTSPKITVEKSKYTFKQALNAQMAKGSPKKSVSYGWINATRDQTSSAMNPKTIWASSTQRYQMLNLGKYQGVPVNKLNQLLSGKGTLHNTGQAFADACKKYNLNEIYLIAHALLESGNGKSNFASGASGVYNYFGIGAFDNNPNNAIPFARRHGWTSPAKAIIGGAKFVREGYINQGQNTLYRMRWNPKNPGYHQYATAIEWCQFQATTIANYYKRIGLRGVYFTRDQYR